LVPLNTASPAYFFGAGAAVPLKSQSPELQVFAATVNVESNQVKPVSGLTVKSAFDALSQITDKYYPGGRSSRLATPGLENWTLTVRRRVFLILVLLSGAKGLF
jgi:hypothetical protein